MERNVGSGSRTGRPGWILVLLLFLPVVLHALKMGQHIRTGNVSLGGLDAAVMAAFVLYVFAGILMMPRPARLARFVLATYAIALPLVAAELFLSSRQAKGLPMTPARVAMTVRGELPGITGTTVFTVNERGVRGPDVWPADRQDRYLCVGGSTTQCFLIGDEDSWPWQLGTMLSTTKGHPILVSNAGVTGHLALHHLYQLTHYSAASDYGTVLVLCGINDAGTLLRRNYAERASRIPLEALAGPAGQGVYYRRLAILKALYNLKSRLDGSQRAVPQDPKGLSVGRTQRTRRERLAMNAIHTVPEGLDEALGRYRETLGKLVDLCRSRDQRLIFLTQPTLYAADLPEDLSHLLTEYTDDGAYTPDVLETVMRHFNETMKDASREFGVECLDLEPLVPKDTTVFYDDCHFNVNGCRQVAGILSDYLLQDAP